MGRVIVFPLVIMAMMVLAPSLTVGQAPPSPAGIKLTPLLRTTTTITGQQIQFPSFHNQVTAVVAEMAPGGQTDRHQHPGVTIVYVMEGTLTVDIEGYGQKVYTAGQAYVEPVNTWHNAANRETTPVRALFIFAGEQEKPRAIRPPNFRQVGMKDALVLQATTTSIGQLILLPLFHPQIVAVHGEFAPGAVNTRHYHPVHQFLYMLDGSLTVEPEGYPRQVYTAGRAFIESLNTWHAAYNRAATPLRFFTVFFGEEGKPVTLTQ